MQLKQVKPRIALNKAFLKVKPNRNEIENFKTNLIQLLDRTNDTESEEFHKNLVIDFLKKTYYEPNHFINTKGRNDLVIHNGEKASNTVGVIIEAKKPTNKTEMISTNKINAKAFHELVLYYLRERITHKNLEVKHLIATNINEWFIFDASLFDRLFAQNKTLVNQFNDFEGGRLADTKTDFFYKQIAEPFISNLTNEIEFTYFNIQDYQKPLRNTDRGDDNILIALFKLLSPEHLLKLPFTNDSNSLDKRFYSELLHIIGLTETKEGGKKLIQRAKENERNSGSILEDAIIQLDSLDKLSRLDKPNQFGSNTQERLFNVGLELSITWINRILFLKLLEAQLITYHKGDKSYSFLNFAKIKNFDDLNSLFFQVLARRYDDRNEDVKKAFEKVPYLNSSLFEPTEIEQLTLFISNLKDDKTIPVISSTVLKNEQGKKRTGNLTTIAYLFEFLNAYDFTSEGSEDIQEDNKSLINASVLGLIFEKINGYKDGSFFTPGFITMYMCRETIRKAVVQKFNETKNWDCVNLDELYDKIEDRKEANDIVNSIKICDPAVGSGHFLVSALNEIIAVKNDLKILQDRDGKRLKEYHVEVVNDELIVTDEEGKLFEYTPGISPSGGTKGGESQRIQETLFHEKQTLIENCLFGVDINPNSVKICRLRLWIELLKNAYYKNTTELETLPNIDINIKCGNSLISRFAIDADLKQALKKSKWTIDSYRIAVDTYRNAESKEQKREMERLIADIKSDFRSEISLNDPKAKKLRKLSGELFQMTQQTQLFEMGKKEKADWNKKIEALSNETKILETEIDEIKSNKIFENAFEWRFEFPEVLNDEGEFVGFDVVIGNPPYIRHEEIKEFKPYFKNYFSLFYGTTDLYVFFIEKGFDILKKQGIFTYIMPNKFMQTGYGKPARHFLLKQNLLEIIDFGDFQVFDEATTYPCILTATKEQSSGNFKTVKINSSSFISDFPHYVSKLETSIAHDSLTDETWIISNTTDQLLLSKLNLKGDKLEDYLGRMGKYGIKTGLTEAFVVDKKTKDELIAKDYKSKELLKPFLLGRNIKPYNGNTVSNWLILIPKGLTIKKNLSQDNPNFLREPMPRYGSMDFSDAWTWFKNEYSAIANHLIKYKTKAEVRSDMGDYWWELRACDYYDKFEQPKIMYQVLQVKPCFIYDESGMFCNNSMWFIPSDDKILLGILNSKLGWWLISKYCTAIQNGYQLIWKYFSQIPIATGTKKQRTEIEKLVNNTLSLKKKDSKEDTTDLESQIDQLVYQLYDLTDEEIKIVEGNG
ncbi:class I SAM-dependent DNA methyltransferase [Pedobacter changchengzhani]|uniref:site-specific DNA-methyltransferase (adenine-specific) n=1 Tax=Pedobacter changchengzhani TaxID=2529274 RepID=A0A4R5MHZ8_9SPHI|nr:Eco57I restriction-modification methylase domain-containing protein [Pedobacter changchengzhani]TDG34926.1 class I SAM-dependent DNA methyltransferase [Pedobacter changchengzhani]